MVHQSMVYRSERPFEAFSVSEYSRKKQMFAEIFDGGIAWKLRTRMKRWAGRSWGGRLRPAGTPSHWGNALGVALDIGYRPSQVGSETT
jgi:hypothetical protein